MLPLWFTERWHFARGRLGTGTLTSTFEKTNIHSDGILNVVAKITTIYVLNLFKNQRN